MKWAWIAGFFLLSAFAGGADRGREHGFSVKRPEVFERIQESGDISRHADSPAAQCAGARVVGVDEVVRTDRGGGRLAVVDRDAPRAVDRVVVEVDDHESAAADPARVGARDGECKAGGDGGVDGVASISQHLRPRPRGDDVVGGNHGVWEGRGIRADGGASRAQRRGGGRQNRAPQWCDS